MVCFECCGNSICDGHCRSSIYVFIFWAFNLLCFFNWVAPLSGSSPYLCHLCHLLVWVTLCASQIVTHKMMGRRHRCHRYGGDTDVTDMEATQMTQIGRWPNMENIKDWKPKKWKHRLKTYSRHHILSYHSTPNTPRAYVGRPTCLMNVRII